MSAPTTVDGTGASAPASALFAPPSPAGGSSGIPLTGVLFQGPAAASSAPADEDRRGLDEKWGDPLSAKLFESDSVQAGFTYYYDAGRNGDQGGVGFSLTFKN